MTIILFCYGKALLSCRSASLRRRVDSKNSNTAMLLIDFGFCRVDAVLAFIG